VSNLGCGRQPCLLISYPLPHLHASPVRVGVLFVAELVHTCSYWPAGCGQTICMPIKWAIMTCNPSASLVVECIPADLVMRIQREQAATLKAITVSNEQKNDPQCVTCDRQTANGDLMSRLAFFCNTPRSPPAQNASEDQSSVACFFVIFREGLKSCSYQTPL
jgi:hypothetical protein